MVNLDFALQIVLGGFAGGIGIWFVTSFVRQIGTFVSAHSAKLGVLLLIFVLFWLLLIALEVNWLQIGELMAYLGIILLLLYWMRRLYKNDED